MKLPKTKYEPTIQNGEPNGIPYRMNIRVIMPGTLNHPEWLELPWPQPPADLTMGCADNTAPYVNVVIPDVPVSSALRRYYDTAPAGADCPPNWASAVTGCHDFTCYGN